MKKNSQAMGNGLPNRSSSRFADLVESGLFKLSSRSKLGSKRIPLNKVLDFDKKKYL